MQRIFNKPNIKNDLGSYRIPIMFYKADGSLQGINSSVAQQSDIYPTILDLLEIDAPHLAFGHSLLDATAPRFAVNYVNNHYQLVQGDYVLQFDGNDAGKVRSLYQYRQDAALQTNLLNAASEANTLHHMERFMRAFLQQYNNRMIEDRLTVEDRLTFEHPSAVDEPRNTQPQ